MPTPYTLPTASDTKDLYHFFKFLTNVSNFIPIMLLVVWFIAFIGSLVEGRQASRGFIFASFIVAILATISSLMGMLNPNYMYFSFILVAAGLIWYKLDNAVGI